MQPILKNKIRILRPCEYTQLREGAVKINNKTKLDTGLLTGLRYVELIELQKKPSWLDDSFVHIPEEKKVKRKQNDRWVRLNPRARTQVEHFFDVGKMPSRTAWNKNLKLWARRGNLNDIGICAKTLRKTLESWLNFYYPAQLQAICLSMGHTSITAIQHYTNLPFTGRDKEEMKVWIEGWI